MRGSFIQHLINEHEIIRRFLDLLRKHALTNSEEIKPIVSALKFYVEGLHHKKEEELLFPALLEAVPSDDPLSIPAEEHVAGHFALENLNQIEDPKVLVETVFRYIRLMERRMRNEEDCLFVLADKYLSAEMQRHLIGRAIEINVDMGLRAYQPIIYGLLKKA